MLLLTTSTCMVPDVLCLNSVLDITSTMQSCQFQKITSLPAANITVIISTPGQRKFHRVPIGRKVDLVIYKYIISSYMSCPDDRLIRPATSSITYLWLLSYLC